MTFAQILTQFAAELALFSAVGFLLFAVNDLAVDLLYFARRLWRSATVYRRYPKAFAQTLVGRADTQQFIAVFVPAWDESAVIAAMLRATLQRLDYGNYRIFVGLYRNDPATAAAVASIADPRVEPVPVEVDGPTTKADCLNHLYDALIAFELRENLSAAAVVLHDAEDVVHPLELGVFNALIDRAAVIQLPVQPLIDPQSRWIAGHYCDEFAEAHAKELVVREAIGASVPLAGVGCAIARTPLARLAALHDGHPFGGGTLTEDYEMGLRLGELGLKTIFVRMPAVPGSRGVVASRGNFPATFGEAVRQKARWLGGIALAGWDRLGWSGGIGERWMRMRDRRGPIAALLLLSGYSAAFLWSQLWLAEALGAPVHVEIDPVLSTLLWINLWLLIWRIAMRMIFTASVYGWREGLRSVPRLVVGNLVAIAAAARALMQYSARRAPSWDKTRHTFPARLPGEASA
ncbi:glycosyl transferase family protein [Sphingomonas sabuli]|uniref:Glycosyl transferase family protein n=1 Tax=Sphingomonas sabuli TaxID=2764186 RepID=A0A7G9KZJ5_9SPHN|nr:glycosyl transferase family protein [Sphingomonas sabuli]QNM81794.1 glycosyl transferase family protein [Sphingomonas sabuli]